MRIALVSTYPPGKGSLNEYAFHFVRHLREKSEVEEVILLVDELPAGVSYPPDEPRGSLAALTIRPCWRFGGWNSNLRIRRAVLETAPDVVLFNMQFATFADQRVPAALGLMTPMMVKAAGVTTAVLLHNIMETVDLKKAGFGGNPIVNYVTRFFGTMFTRLLLKADLVAVTIPKYVEILTQKYGAQHVMLGPHGAFEKISEPTYQLPDGPAQIMAFGKFGTYKKVETLIEAFDILQNQLPDHPLELVIAGTDSPNTPGYLTTIQQRYSHVKHVRYTGYVEESDVASVFGSAAVVVFPYNSTTGSSGVLHQAGSYGKAVVLPNLGDLAELVTEEGYVGQFFIPENASSMAEAIAQLLLNPEHRVRCEMQNFLAATGLPMSEVVDWYLLHFERLLQLQTPHQIVFSQESH